MYVYDLLYKVFVLFPCAQRFIFPEDQEQNIVIFIIAMCSLRHISFATEYCFYHSMPPNKRPDQKHYWSILDFLLYIYYFPLFFSGPLLTYDKFSRQVDHISGNLHTFDSVGLFLFSLIRS